MSARKQRAQAHAGEAFIKLNGQHRTILIIQVEFGTLIPTQYLPTSINRLTCFPTSGTLAASNRLIE